VDTRYAADLDLARRCADGDEQAWESFMRDYRPVLRRAAQALDSTGGAREVADSLYAELYGVRGAGAGARSLFRYYEGRSSLTTWLRAVLAQRYIDQVRSRRRLEPLPDEEDASLRGGDDTRRSLVRSGGPPNLDRPRYLTVVRAALQRAVTQLAARDRLRLACYYMQDLTLAQVGRVLTEHEATVSRHLARTRRAVRRAVERDLRAEAGLTEVQIDECFACAVDDPGPLDLRQVFGAAADDTQTAAGRS